jgi:hypothetical protein
MHLPGRRMTLVEDLQLMLGLAQELWRDDPRGVQCPYGRIAALDSAGP